MPHQPTDDKTLGIYLEGTQLLAAFVVKERRATHIKSLFTLPLEDPSSADWLALLILTDKHLTAAALPQEQVLIRRLRLKLTHPKDIDETFSFQAETLFPFPVDQALLDKTLTEKQEDSTLLTVFAAKNEYVENFLAKIHHLKIFPEVISAPAAALVPFCAEYLQPSPACFIIYQATNHSFCALLREGKLLATHSLEGNNPSLEAFAMEIQWNYLALTKETKIKELPSLLLLGTPREGLEEKISALIGLEKAQPKSEELFSSISSFAIPLGLALSVQPGQKTINFLQETVTSSLPWKRFKKPLLSYAGACLGLALALYLFQASYTAKQERNLQQQYLSLLSFLHKSYDEAEKDYASKYPLEHPEAGAPPISSLDAESLSRRLDFLNQQLRAAPDAFPLIPLTPRVSDLLAWINSLPAKLCTEEPTCPEFKIESLNYTMAKRPEQGKRNEHYQVKIEIEFSTPSARLARAFHDALITPNEMIDPKAEIKWNATKGKYRTSFYLKDKTNYQVSAP